MPMGPPRVSSPFLRSRIRTKMGKPHAVSIGLRASRARGGGKCREDGRDRGAGLEGACAICKPRDNAAELTAILSGALFVREQHTFLPRSHRFHAPGSRRARRCCLSGRCFENAFSKLLLLRGRSG